MFNKVQNAQECDATMLNIDYPAWVKKINKYCLDFFYKIE
jgi:hypothetical protein